ncbi:MAG TPA: PQQ-dependent sugar dehydrogenase [Woeseiaceae bacterium]|nr:PQQ-dependent sugar dehydrogenase [Woeseiaceae bacterium]
MMHAALPGDGFRRTATGVTLIVATLIAACGGSGGGDATNPPSATVNPSLAIEDAIITEGDTGNSNLQFTVQASVIAPSAGSIASATVDYSTSAGTATEGVDYLAATGTLQIPGGTTQVTIDIEIIGDTEVEANETFTVTLSSPVNATISNATATGTIRDDDSPTGASGLDGRPDNQTCVAPARPTANSLVSVSDPYPSLPDLVQPTKILLEPVAAGRWFVLQKSGQIVSFATSNPGSVSNYMDLTTSHSIRTNSEGGLLGMAFHPDYPATPEIFLSYTIEHSGPSMRSVLSRMVLDDVNNPGAGTTEQVILEVDQPFDNHNGGDIAFGPDGYLYFGLGDGGSGNDPGQRAQDTTRLLGSMLRIDVVGTGAGYDIPPDNPFAPNAKCGPGDNANSCPEIYAWGLRNPWRWSFDPATGALWVADVGQGAWEEVDLVELGGNYGWRCREGAHDTTNAADCSGGGLVDPVTEYGRSLGNSITGGQVYRGSAIPDLAGLYVFADYGSGRFWAARPDGEGGYINDELIDTNFQPTAFSTGPDGELYFVDINGSNGRGRVRRIDPTASAIPDTIPDLLSATGCVDPNDVTQPYEGLLPYDVNASFWSDGADKDRYIGLPNGSTIGIDAAGDFQFPSGTVIVKNFRLGGNLVETRHLMRHPDGVWAGYTYEWNSAQTEATRVRGGKVVDIDGQNWIYPSEGQCMECHTSAAGFALGPEIAQLNKDFIYPATGRLANQLETLDHVMMFTDPMSAPVSTLDALADPEDTGAALAPRARAYLHTNCAQCHRPNGPTPATMDLRYPTALANTNACDALPLEGDLGIANARLIAPGNSAASLVVARMQRRDSHGMPPLGSSLVDTLNVARISGWIDSLGSCN